MLPYRTLKLYFSSDRKDHFSPATKAGYDSTADSNYEFVRDLGQIYDQASSSAYKKLKLFYNDPVYDNVSVAIPEEEQALLDQGYHFIRDQGFIYAEGKVGRRPLIQMYHEEVDEDGKVSKDHYLVATWDSLLEALLKGYKILHVEGWID